MKNFSKKHGFFAAAAALLAITAMLVTIGCSNDIIDGEFTPPPGMGAIRLSINANARSIFPEALDKNDFDSFYFEFDATSGGTDKSITVPNTPTDLATPIPLDPGTYNLTVTAKIGANTVATGTIEDIEIVAAKTVNKSIMLSPIISGSGNGTFEYNISSTIVSDLSTAIINFSPTSGGSAYATINLITGDIEIDSSSTTGSGTLIGNGVHTISLPAGYYYLDFIIKAKSGDEVTFREILLIAQNIKSTYPSFTIAKDYFYGSLTVTLDCEDAVDNKPVLGIGPSFTTEYAEGETVAVTKGNTLALTVKNAGVFDSFEWYTQGNTVLTGGVSGANGEVYTVDTAGDSIFSMKKTYQLTIIGIKGGVYYSSYIYIKVE